MKNILLWIMIVLMVPVLSAEEPDSTLGWKNEIISTLNYTQNSFDNWAPGGEDSWSWLFNMNGNFNLKKTFYTWNNSFKIAYGKSRVADQEARKANDEIRFESVLKYLAGFYVDPYASFSGNTQITKGYKYSGDTKTPVSDLLDPLYLTESVGVGYEPNDRIKSRIGAAVKHTMSDQYADIYADGEKNRMETGVESVTDLNLKFNQNLVFTSKLKLFSNMKGMKNVDVDWDNMFVSDVTKWIKVSLNVRIFYDSDISSKRQLMQVLAVGVSYKLL